MSVVLCKVCDRFIDTDKDVWHGWEHAIPCPSPHCDEGYRTDDVADGDDGQPVRAQCPECDGEGCLEHPDWM